MRGLHPGQRAAIFSGGVSLPTDIAGLETYIDASLETGYADTNAVTTPTEQSGNSVGFTQGGAAGLKPRYLVDQFGSLPGYDFIAANSQRWEIASGWTVASGDKTLVSVVDIDLETGQRILLDVETGRIICGIDGTGDEYAFYDGAWRASGTAGATGAQVLIYVLEAGGTARIYRGLSLIGSGLSYTQQAVGGKARIGSDNTDATFFDGRIGMQAFYSAAMSDSDRVALTSSLMSKWGIS